MWQSRPRLRDHRGVSHLPQVASLPALPVPPTVHLYEHIHEHHHFVYRAPELPSQEVQEAAAAHPERTKRPKKERLARPERPQRPERKESDDAEMVIPRIVVEQVPDRPASESQEETHTAAPGVPCTDSAESFPRWKKDARPKPKAIPKPAMDFLTVGERSREQLESRSSVASSRCVSRQSSPAAKVKLAKAAQAAEDDPLAMRLKLMEAETLWSDLRRDLRRHLRELPDSSKSKAKQKLMGRMVSGTSKDRARLEHQKAKEHEESRELVRHVEEELKACSRSRHKVLRMQELLRRRGVQFFR